jgi:hypothetical protein
LAPDAGVDGAVTSEASADGAVVTEAGAPAACANDTFANYLALGSCSQTGPRGSTVYVWTSYTCTSTPSSICAALGANGANVEMKQDPKGPYTLLVGDTSAWNVGPGQSVHVELHGSVYGATANQNWPHFELPDKSRENGQAGDGTEENVTTVECGAGCLTNNGISDILCSSNGPAENCSDQQTIAPYAAYAAKFAAAIATNPYPLTIEVKLNGNTTGTAALFSVGTHLVP